MDASHRENQETFFRLIFADESGYVCIARRNIEDSKWHEQYFKIPNEYPRLLTYISQHVKNHDLWYCPQLLAEPKRTKQSVASCPTAWADLDGCPPSALLVRPTVAVESSPGRYQALWRFNSPQDPKVGEDTSRRIAYGHVEDGADKTGWDLTQLLRVPYTGNYKYEQPDGGPPQVRIVIANGLTYDPEDFDVYGEPPPTLVDHEAPLPTLTKSGVELLIAKKDELSPVCEILFYKEPDPHRRSDDLWRLEMSLFESGLLREEVFSIARESKVNKYAQDGRSDAELWKEVLRAEENYKALAPTPPTGPQFSPLLSDTERASMKANETLIEEYIRYGALVSDASPQYHEAGIFVILSSLLSGSIQIPTKHSVVPTNLWFLILAETTLTRKTTSMEIALSILLDISPGAMLASDGSMEGLFHALSTRPSIPSLFRRDEVSGLFEAMVRKDYQAGMMEALSNLYDGTHQRRILRRETFDVYKPRLIFFGGGIKNRLAEILTPAHVESGFLPRFVMITAAADPSRIRPEGPPSHESDFAREEIVEKLREIYNRYNAEMRVGVNGHVATAKKTWDARLTPEAWEFYNRASGIMRGDAYMSETKRGMLIPMYERLARSGMKAAALIAATRDTTEDGLTVEVEDLHRAFYYVEEWRKYAYEMIDNLNKNPFENLVDKVSAVVVEHPGITRAKIMGMFRLTAKQTDDLLNTLEQRGMLDRKGVRGKAERLWPIWAQN